MNKIINFIEEIGRVPIIPLAGFPGIQLTGVTLKEAVFNADTQIEALLALYNETKPDALFTMMDLTVEAEYLGCELKISENAPPAVLGHDVVTDEASLKEAFKNKTTGGRMQLFADVVKGLKKELSVPVCAYVIGPFTLAGEIMGLVNAMKATKKRPEFMKAVLEETTKIIMNYITLLEEAGADLICILEPSAMMISPKQFQAFSKPYCTKIISESIQTMSVLHICGNTTHLLTEMEDTCPEGLSLDVQVDFPAARTVLKKSTVLIGNINPMMLASKSDPAGIKEKSINLLSEMDGEQNFILSTGCDVPHNAPIENLKAMIDAN